MIQPAEAARLRAPLLRWYGRAKRDLPWRRTKDPYAIWVSEAMLQQTTVAAVVPYWERFLERFPDLKTLASSREDDVLAAWSGLGYYRRARALREGAIAVMERHGGRVPRELHALIDLPGIGRYTAGAIASVAFGDEVPVVDGNVKRVFSRLFAMRGEPSAARERAYWSIAAALVAGAAPGDWNQALMELGATVCTPREPRCDECPLARWCRGRALGRPTAFPRREQAAPVRIVPVAVAWVERRSRVLLERRHPDGPFRGVWDLPAAIVPSGVKAGRAIVRAVSERHGLRLRDRGVLVKAKHSILATRLTIEVVNAVPTFPVPRRVSLRWVSLDRLSEVPISGATSKIARVVAARESSEEPVQGRAS
jgi:A/G-specific adenine glycosylase